MAGRCCCFVLVVLSVSSCILWIWAPFFTVERGTWTTETSSVPFYVYNGSEFRAFDTCDRSKLKEMYFFNDLFFIDSLANHPWRVTDPNLAVLYIVPIPVAPVIHGICGDVGQSHVKAAVEVVENSPHYRANWGWDHMIIALDYQFPHGNPSVLPLRDLAANFTVAHFLYTHESPWRCTVQTPFALPLLHPKVDVEPVLTAKEYLSKRPYTLFFQGQTWPNSGYEIRRSAFNTLPGFHSPNILISTADTPPRDNPELAECLEDDLKTLDAPVDPAGHPPTKGPEGCKDSSNWGSFQSRMSKAKFNLFFRGDDVSSARMYDTLMQRTLSIMFSDGWLGTASPFQCKVPWEKMLFWGSEANFTADPLKEINAVFSGITEEAIEERLLLIERYRAEVLWQLPDNAVTSNVIFDAARRCVPKKLLEKNGMLRSDMKCKFADYNHV